MARWGMKVSSEDSSAPLPQLWTMRVLSRVLATTMPMCGRRASRRQVRTVSDGESAGEGVAGGGSAGVPELRFVASPEGFKVEHAAVVDVGVRMRESPGVRVGCEVALHVFVDETLKIEAEAVATGSHDDVGADNRWSAARLRWGKQCGCSAVVGGGDAELSARGGGETVAGFGRRGKSGCGEAGESGLEECAAQHAVR